MFIAYIYDPFWNPITQLIGINKFGATIKLNWISEASFEIASTNPEAKYSVLKWWNRVKVTRLEDSAETDIIEWIFYMTIAQDSIQVQIKDFNTLFQKKKILVDTTLNWPLNTFLTSMLNTVNTRQDTWFTIDCDVTTTVTLDPFKKWSSVYDVLQKIAEAGYEYTFADRKLIVKQTIWSDRTTGPDYYEFTFNIDELWWRNIRNDKQTYNFGNVANVVYDQNWNVLEDAESVIEFWRIEDWVTTSANQTLSTYLVDRKILVKEIEITPIKINFFDVNLGDLVKCYIKKESDLQYFNDSVKITEKRVTWSDLKKTEIKLAKGTVKTLDIFDTIRQLQERQRQLELQ